MHSICGVLSLLWAGCGTVESQCSGLSPRYTFYIMNYIMKWQHGPQSEHHGILCHTIAFITHSVPSACRIAVSLVKNIC